MKKLFLLLLTLSCFYEKVFGQEYLHQDRMFLTVIDSRNYDKKQKQLISSNHIKTVIEIRTEFRDKKVRDTLYKNDFNKAGALISYSHYYENKPDLNYVYLYSPKGYIISDTTQDRANRYYYDKFNNIVRYTFYDHSPSSVYTSLSETLQKFNSRGDIINEKYYFKLFGDDKVTAIQHVLMEDRNNVYDDKRRLIKLSSTINTPTGSFTSKQEWSYKLKGDTLISHHKTSSADITKMNDVKIKEEDVLYDKWGNKVKMSFLEPEGKIGMEKHIFNHLGQLMEITLESHYKGKLSIETTKYDYDDAGNVSGNTFYKEGKLFSRSIYYYQKY